MLRPHTTEIFVLGDRVRVIELQIESRQAVYVVRLWPNGVAQRLRNWAVLTNEAEVKQQWKGPYSRLLDESFRKLRPKMSEWLRNPTDAGYEELKTVVNGFNETSQKGNKS